MLKLLLPSFVACRRLLNNRDEEETEFAEHGPQSKKEDIFNYIYRALTRVVVVVVWMK